jgi:heptosyltransferase-2
VSLWGATSAERSAPFGSERLVVQGEAPCAPCFLRECPIGRICMQDITPDVVLEKARQGLAA